MSKPAVFNLSLNNQTYVVNLESAANWLSCNGEVMGVGPTMVFASAAALFLYSELKVTVLTAGDLGHVSSLETSLLSTMVVGMLALMVHIWVCTMRFFLYYLDTVIKDSPSVFLEMTTVSLFGSKSPDILPISTLAKFIRTQQPQIHLTVCWFLSLCYADYVRKHYCRTFSLPYLEAWQTQLNDCASRGINNTMTRMSRIMSNIQLRLRGYSQTQSSQQRTEATATSFRICDDNYTAHGGPGTFITKKSTEQEVCSHLASSDAVDAIEKLRKYVKATRCPCTGLYGVPNPGLPGTPDFSETPSE